MEQWPVDYTPTCGDSPECHDGTCNCDSFLIWIIPMPFGKWGWECPECRERQVRPDGYAHRGTAMELGWAHARLCTDDWDTPVYYRDKQAGDW